MTTAGLVKSQTAFSLANMLAKNNLDCKILFKEGPNQPLNREVIAELAQQMECTHLLFIDSDMVFATDAASRLLEPDKDIIGTNYNMRLLPPTSTVQMGKGETVKKELFQCRGVATGFMLINMEIFKKLEKPWFHVGLNGTEIEGHDYRFCRLAREAGYTVWGDPTIPIGHIGDTIY